MKGALSGSSLVALAVVGGLAGYAGRVVAQDRPAAERPYEVEWVYRVKYGHQAEWWKIFQTYQIAILDKEKQLGYVKDYIVQRPGLHTSEDSRWDYRILITYTNWEGSTHEEAVERQLFPDHTQLDQDEQNRWELTLNHWDLPIREVDPHKQPG